MLPAHLPRLKAPRNHGELLAYPPLDAVGDLLRSRGVIAGSFLGRPLSDLRSLAHRETLAAAHQYLATANEPVPEFDSARWLVAGHQPELFHPGVWIKNFVLQTLAKRHGATPLNVVIDNDVAKSANLRVLVGDRVVAVPFDGAGGDGPFEERIVRDVGVFNSLPARVQELTHDWPFRPWVGTVWNHLRNAGTRNLGERIVRGRRALERTMGLRPLEVPLSALCRTEAFAWFASSVLADLPRFVGDYNAAVHAYRARHDLKSKNHPVPDLARQGEAFEAPFWVWRTGDPRRQRLFAIYGSHGLQLLAGSTPLICLPGTAADWIEAWPTLERQGIKIRTRALTTTLFLRLMLADLFLHGIGGGKYDEVTNDLMTRHFGITPPHYLVVTATLLLPFPRIDGIQKRWLDLKRQQRDLWYNPQRHLSDSAAETLLAEKRAALAMPEQTHDQRIARFRRLLQATADLRPFVAAQIASLESEMNSANEQRRRDEIASARDYSFCLYPEEMLRQMLPELGGTP